MITLPNMEDFLKKIADGDITTETTGTFDQYEWEVLFPKWLVETCHIAVHEIEHGVWICLQKSIERKLLQGRVDIREELRAVNNRYFYAAISDEGGPKQVIFELGPNNEIICQLAPEVCERYNLPRDVKHTAHNTTSTFFNS